MKRSHARDVLRSSAMEIPKSPPIGDEGIFLKIVGYPDTRSIKMYVTRETVRDEVVWQWLLDSSKSECSFPGAAMHSENVRAWWYRMNNKPPLCLDQPYIDDGDDDDEKIPGMNEFSAVRTLYSYE